MEDLRNYINSVRRDFANRPLDENNLPSSPFELFEKWFEDAVASQILDPYAMIISTVNVEAKPSSRVVYMRDIKPEGLIFYTNYKSHKSKDLLFNPNISVLFFWGELERQIRIEGLVEQVSAEVSDQYFASRPRESQIGAWASDQSDELISREELEKKVDLYSKKFEKGIVPRPPHWGGFLIKVNYFEFWQGRPNRLHDRISYQLSDSGLWIRGRLQP